MWPSTENVETKKTLNPKIPKCVQSRVILLSSDSEAEEDVGPLSVMKRWFTGRKTGCALGLQTPIPNFY